MQISCSCANFYFLFIHFFALASQLFAPFTTLTLKSLETIFGKGKAVSDSYTMALQVSFSKHFTSNFDYLGQKLHY
jgi:hypothetical protein